MRRLLTALALVLACSGVTASPAAASLTTNTIRETATLLGNGQVARGTVLLACTAGQQVAITLTLTQGATTGTGRGAGVCTGELTAYPVTVVARGGTFVAGTAE